MNLFLDEFILVKFWKFLVNFFIVRNFFVVLYIVILLFLVVMMIFLLFSIEIFEYIKCLFDGVLCFFFFYFLVRILMFFFMFKLFFICFINDWILSLEVVEMDEKWCGVLLFGFLDLLLDIDWCFLLFVGFLNI